MKPPRPAARTGAVVNVSDATIATNGSAKRLPIESIAVPDPAKACAAVSSDQPRKMTSRPFFVPTRSINAPAGT